MNGARGDYFKLVAPKLKINIKEVNKENLPRTGDEKPSDAGL